MKKKETKSATANPAKKQKAPAPAKLKPAVKQSKNGKSHPEKDAETPAPAGARGHAAAETAAAVTDPAKMTRVALIKARHEAMKREIDQIREDLESEEEE